VASFVAVVLTEIYLCNVCACPEMLRRRTAPRPPSRPTCWSPTSRPTPCALQCAAMRAAAAAAAAAAALAINSYGSY
jgi:hypothetical protein